MQLFFSILTFIYNPQSTQMVQKDKLEYHLSEYMYICHEFQSCAKQNYVFRYQLLKNATNHSSNT